MSNTKDINSEVRAVSSLLPQSLTATQTGNNIVDMQGAEAGMLVANLGAMVGGDVNNFFTLKVVVGNDPALADGVDVAAADYFGGRFEDGTAWDRTVKATNKGCAQIGFINSGATRYARIDAVKTATPTSLLASGNIIKGGLRTNP